MLGNKNAVLFKKNKGTSINEPFFLLANKCGSSVSAWHFGDTLDYVLVLLYLTVLLLD